MSREVRHYTFKSSIPAEEVENTLLLAVFAAEGLHGQARVRLEAAYSSDPEKRTFVIDATTDVGLDIARLFTGFAIREYGEEAFSVRRVELAAKKKDMGATA